MWGSTTKSPIGHEKKRAIMKNNPAHLGNTAGDRPTPGPAPLGTVSDPHPGSVSDGTHPEADETKLPRKEGDGKHGTAN